MKFLADEDFNQAVINGLRRQRRAIDFLSAREGGVLHRPDEEVLKSASKLGRVLVTHDRNTMPGHFARFIGSQSSPGLIVVSQNLAVGVAIEQLLLIWECMNDEEMVNVLLFVPL